jgi:hypothetical protein
VPWSVVAPCRHPLLLNGPYGNTTAFARLDLSGVDYVYVWVDGIHFNVRLEEDRPCALVIVGVRADGTKELVAIEDGYRESKESLAAPASTAAGRRTRRRARRRRPASTRVDRVRISVDFPDPLAPISP